MAQDIFLIVRSDAEIRIENGSDSIEDVHILKRFDGVCSEDETPFLDGLGVNETEKRLIPKVIECSPITLIYDSGQNKLEVELRLLINNAFDDQEIQRLMYRAYGYWRDGYGSGFTLLFEAEYDFQLALGKNLPSTYAFYNNNPVNAVYFDAAGGLWR